MQRLVAKMKALGIDHFEHLLFPGKPEFSQLQLYFRVPNGKRARILLNKIGVKEEKPEIRMGNFWRPGVIAQAWRAKFGRPAKEVPASKRAEIQVTHATLAEAEIQEALKLVKGSVEIEPRFDAFGVAKNMPKKVVFKPKNPDLAKGAKFIADLARALEKEGIERLDNTASEHRIANDVYPIKKTDENKAK